MAAMAVLKQMNENEIIKYQVCLKKYSNDISDMFIITVGKAGFRYAGDFTHYCAAKDCSTLIFTGRGVFDVVNFKYWPVEHVHCK